MSIKKLFIAVFAMLCFGSTFGATLAFTPTGQTQLAVGTTSSNVAWPTTGSPTQIVVNNLGPLTAYVQLGNGSVTSSVASGMAILPYTDATLVVGANTNIAAITQGGSTVLSITPGIPTSIATTSGGSGSRTGASSNSSVGTTSAQIIAAGTYSSWVTIQNTHASQTLYLSFNTPATTSDIKIIAGASITLPFGLANALYGIASGASTTYAIIGN